jgi:hypothetical protein
MEQSRVHPAHLVELVAGRVGERVLAHLAAQVADIGEDHGDVLRRRAPALIELFDNLVVKPVCKIPRGKGQYLRMAA